MSIWNIFETTAVKAKVEGELAAAAATKVVVAAAVATKVVVAAAREICRPDLPGSNFPSFLCFDS